MIISHLYKNNDGIWNKQSNEEHSIGVAKLCKKFASEFGMGEWGEIIGLLHDKGKEKTAFQQHIKKESGYDPNIIVEGEYNHAYVGALLAYKYYHTTAPLFINTIMGHHRGLYDNGDMLEIMKKQIPSEIDETNIYKTDLKVPPLPIQEKDLHILERMLYSCLVDADYLDTEAFMQPNQAALRGGYAQLSELLIKLENRLDSFKQNAKNTEINKIRNYVQEQCRLNSDSNNDFYSLTVPTGGGKTLSSVLWALRHAIRNKQKRIIIVIPYTSIIVQTAQTLKGIFGDKNVLEHHSNVNYEDTEEKSDDIKQSKLATENWDAPIIVTTNVQLFESLFSNKPSTCRKIHNIVKSVIILDEVQTLPTEFLQPIVDSLDSLKRIFGCSILFTTASQPILVGKHQGTNYQVHFDGLPAIKEIIPAETNLHDKLRRVQLIFHPEPLSYDEVANKIAEHDKILCIVNTRKDAKELYERLPKEGITLHLSRMMCPSHISETISLIKEAIQNPKNKIIRIIATQLIEAGVDIDFPVVFRQEAGLDSILQAAGRCNREGKLTTCNTYVFSLAAEHALPPGTMSQTNNARKSLAKDLDWFAPETMDKYFQQLFCRCHTFDKPQVKSLLYTEHLQFETAAKNFKLIEDEGISIIINWRNSMKYIEQLIQNGISYSLIKKLAQYSVNIKKRDFKELTDAGAIEEVLGGIYCIKKTSFYKEDIGLTTANQWIEEILIK